jgi:hypothetical protein
MTPDEDSVTGTPVAILERPVDVPTLLALPAFSRGSCLVVATSPGVCWELEKHEVPYRSLEDYCSPEELYQIGRENFRTVDRICALLDESLSQQLDTLQGVLKPATDNHQFIKFLYDALSIRIHLLRRLVTKERASQVITMGQPGGLGLHDYYGPLTEEENIFPALLDLRGWPCRHVRIDRPADDGTSEGFSRPAKNPGRVGRFLRTRSLVIDSYTTAKIHGMAAAAGIMGLSLRNLFHRRKYLYIATYSHNWYAMIPHFYRKGYSTVHLKTFNQTLQEAGRSLDITLPLSLREFCTCGPVDFTQLFMEYLLHLFQVYRECAPSLARTIDDLFRSKPPEALLFGARPSFLEQIPAHIAQKRGIPVITWQHGGAGYFDQPIQLYDELMNSDFHFAWGPSTRDQMARDDLNRFPCRICAVGSMECESIHRSSPSYTRREYALYVTSMYNLSRFIVAYRYPPRDNHLWAVQKQILQCLARHCTPTIFKMHPTSGQEGHILEYLKDPAFRTIAVIKGERRFADLIPDADFIVIDGPSTVLIQGAATTKPLFVLLSFIRLTDEAEELLRKRAFCYRTLDEILAALANHLEGRDMDQHPDVNNTEFLEQYGICSTTEPVGTRALAALDRILKRAP